uniref:RNA-directed RNA polymerase L n=1 Tax=Rhodopi bunya-like virus TaxID=2805759 RepID=A0A889IP29_9VIRU|nr:MAG: RNA-dependent RNA polymerase [Rhodopi bunya-like virus]
MSIISMSSSMSGRSLVTLNSYGELHLEDLSLKMAICYSGLFDLVDLCCEYVEQDLVITREMFMHVSLPHSCFNLGKDVLTDLWEWSIIVPKGSFEDDPEMEVNLRGARNDNGMRKLRHDIVGMAISPLETDVKLSSIFKQLQGTEEGRLTPDFHFEIKGVNVFVEIGTTKAEDPSHGESEVRRKIFKYSHALKSVSHSKPCILMVIIVGKHFVCSNYSLSPQIVKPLILHMNLALLLELRISGLNLPALMSPFDSSKEVMMEQIKHSIKNILEVEDVPNGGLYITSQLIDSLNDSPDMEKVSQYFLREISKARESFKLNYKKGVNPRADERREKLISTLKTQDSRSYQKAIVTYPLFTVKRQLEFDSEVRPFAVGPEDGRETAVTKLWAAGFRGYMASYYDYAGKHELTLSEMYETDKAEQDRILSRNKEFRKMAHRCDVKGVLSEEELRTLALDGVWGKKYQADEEKMDKHKTSKKPYHFDTPIDDIERFLSDSSIYEQMEEPVVRMETDLLELAMANLKQDTRSLLFLKDIQKSKIYCALDIISDIAMELTVSIKQHTKPGQVLIKKLGFYDVYLMIIPTTSSEHLFYSIYIPPQEKIEVLCSLPFRILKPAVGGGFYTEFCSVRADKLANQATVASTFIGLMAYFSYHYKITDITCQNFRSMADAVTMANFTLLVRLENKPGTEESITVSRYMYMEILKSHSFIRPDPYRLIGKLPVCIRSRLQLFVTRRLIIAFDRMIEFGARKITPDDQNMSEDKEEDGPSNDYWSGLINPYTLNSEINAGRVVNLFYIGYAVDKDQVSQENSDYKTIQKAIQKDREFIEEEEERSSGLWDEFEETPKEKQFSPNVIKAGCKIMGRELTKTYGPDFKEVLANKIIERLASHMTNDLATLKASARIEHLPWDQIPTADHSLKERKGRLKVIEAIMREIGLFKHNPFISSDVIINLIEKTSRGVISDLFKKNQHGGLREIYVLTIKSRMVALIIETCSRVICEQFDCEAMTHPNKKMEIIERHKILASKLAHAKSTKVSEYQCSSDKKSWNNNLVMPALAIPLLMLLPSYMHGMIQRILNMWNERLIQLPYGVMKLLVNKTPLSCATFQEIAQEFMSPGSTGRAPLFPYPGANSVIIRTGMMQGILHYTSSLLHVSYLKITTYLIKSYYKVNFKDSICIVDQMCSSDDSATIISVSHPKQGTPDDDIKLGLYSEVLCQALTTFCNYSCFTNSEKTTSGSGSQLEFNSEFIMGNTLAVPIIKWVLASFGVSESQSLLLRQQTLYNLMSQVSSSGLPAQNTTLLQLSQGLLHYKLMGSSLNRYFVKYYEDIQWHSDPNLGFFLIDNIYVPGVLGFSYHHWLHCKIKGLFQIRKKSVLDGSLGFNPEGGLIDSFLVKHGDSKRYETMVTDMSDGLSIQETRDFINSTPLLLYSQATDEAEARYKVLSKALTPGTAQALSRGVPFLQAVATSVYGLQTFCYTRSEASYDSAASKMTRNSNKISLLGELRRRRIDMDTIQHDSITSEALCFPNHRIYKEYYASLHKFKNAEMIPVRMMRHKKSTMRFPHAHSAIPIPLFDLVKEKWADIPTRQSVQLVNKCWKEYQSLMPWLKDSLSETLESSPFLDHVELYNFVSSSSKKSRKFVRVGPAIRSAHPQGQIEQIARRTYCDGYVLRIKDNLPTENQRLYKDRRTCMSLALEIPARDQRKMMVEFAAKQNPINPGELESITERGKREAILAVLVSKINGTVDEEIYNTLESMGNGLFINWIDAQKKEVINKGGKISINWRGVGSLLLSNKSFACLARVEEDEVQMVEVNNMDMMRKHQFMVLKIFKEQGLRTSSKILNRSCRVFLSNSGLAGQSPGTPVWENPNKTILQPSRAKNARFSIKIDQGCLSLVQHFPDLRPSTVISYRVHQQEFGSYQDSSITRNVWDAWYNQSKLDSSVANDLVISTVSDSSERTLRMLTKDQKLEALAMRSFVRSTLSARLKHKGYSDGTTHPQMCWNDDEDSHEGWEDEFDADAYLRDADDYFEEAASDQQENVELCSILPTSDQPEEQEAEKLFEDCLEDEDLAAILDHHIIDDRGVELTSNRLISRYGIMHFWDDLIDKFNAVNPLAWSHILNGRTVPGILNSDYFVKLLLERDATPGPSFGTSIHRSLSSEALVASYSPSISSSHRSKTSVAVDVVDMFKSNMMKLMEESKLFVGNDEMLRRIEGLLETAAEKTVDEAETLIEEDKEEIERSVAEGDLQSVVSKVEEWALSSDLISRYDPSDLLSSDHLDYLVTLLKKKTQLELSDSVLTISSVLRGGDPSMLTKTPELTGKQAYFCLLGDSHNGHWVSFISGVRTDGKLEFVDTAKNDRNLRDAMNQMQKIFPSLDLDDISILPVRQQSLPTCGHGSFMYSSHRLLDWPVPDLFDCRNLQKWVGVCLEQKEIRPMEENLSLFV